MYESPLSSTRSQSAKKNKAIPTSLDCNHTAPKSDCSAKKRAISKFLHVDKKDNWNDLSGKQREQHEQDVILYNYTKLLSLLQELFKKDKEKKS